ncbi:probable tetraacyldisaccharide 4'-kinase, mitochondrial [Typha angustifolia]|uniref:probable tetraacyldisaccharide 4'-kinase, mitochondrial n=1 Tax=Typha angustifolia TaxID=59011 RepID=UPI003C2D65B1
MERLKRAVIRIAAAPDSRISDLPLLHRSFLLSFLSFASSLYRLSLSLRRRLYLSGLIRRQRLPVPVISVGNVTWGGTGKTPMVEYIARFLDDSGVSSLILTRGYAGGDEAKMLQRHLLQTSARIGIGANRTATAASIFDKYGYTDPRGILKADRILPESKFVFRHQNEKVGVAILDDGMQHWSLLRDVEIVMLNSLTPWGNTYLIPRGPLREPLSALGRADIIVLHNADMVSAMQLKVIESTVRNICATLPIFFSRLVPSHLFGVTNPRLRLPLSLLKDVAVLCVSAIGSPEAFSQAVREIGPLHVDRLAFIDHHFIQSNDVQLIREKVRELATQYNCETVIVVTEKDYDRDPNIFKEMDDLKVWVLCSSMQMMPLEAQKEEDFRRKVKELLVRRQNRA